MINIEQFAYLCIMRNAIDIAKPGMQGSGFTWKNSFPKMAITHTRTQWWMANRSVKVFDKNIEKVERIANLIAKEFSEIQGRE